jgi:hypothetical protein
MAYRRLTTYRDRRGEQPCSQMVTRLVTVLEAVRVGLNPLAFHQIEIRFQLRDLRGPRFEISLHLVDDLAAFVTQIDYAAKFGPRYVHSARLRNAGKSARSRRHKRRSGERSDC